MTTKSRKFYVGDDTISNLNIMEHFKMSLSDKSNRGIHKHEITISWKEPRKVTISEDEFEKIYSDYARMEGETVYEYLKRTIFGDE